MPISPVAGFQVCVVKNDHPSSRRTGSAFQPRNTPIPPVIASTVKPAVRTGSLAGQVGIIGDANQRAWPGVRKPAYRR